jgi:hypothetical protein
MPKLHEVLAVEPSIKGAADSILAETEKVFDGRNAAYTGHSKVYLPLNDQDTDKPPADTKAVGYTVPQKIAYLSDAYVRLLDVLLQKEQGNQKAKADLTITVDEGGVEKETVLAKDVPATLLLTLEHRFEALRKVLLAAPTCDPNFQWKRDPNGLGYISDPIETQRTKKVPVHAVVVQATEHHPAQIKSHDEDVPVGKWTRIEKSGALLVSEKSRLLARVDALIRGAKKARMRANDIEVGNAKMGKAIFDFLRGDLV